MQLIVLLETPRYLATLIIVGKVFTYLFFISNTLTFTPSVLKDNFNRVSYVRGFLIFVPNCLSTNCELAKLNIL